MEKQDKIRTFRNHVFVDFAKAGERYTLKVPHYGIWQKLISFLRKRGFTIGENPYFKKQFAAISKYHKIGYKKDVVCLMQISAIRIEIQLGHIKNLWVDAPQSFWDNPTDSRYTHLTYLELKTVQLEKEEVICFFQNYGMPLTIQDKKLSPEEYIIDKLKNNKHIHGVVNCLNDIKDSIKPDSTDYRQNSDDKNKKKIICGDKKYFYDYGTKRLCCGIAWHNINNMWWVISGNQLHNIVCWELFDYDATLTRKKLLDTEQRDRLLKNLKQKKIICAVLL